MTAGTPVADDFDAIAKRLAELAAERAAAEKARAAEDARPGDAGVWR